MQRILVPTDFSDEAEYALKVAADLARRFNSEIFVLHVLEIPLTEVDAFSSHSALPEPMFFIKMAEKKFQEIEMKEYLQNLTIHKRIKRDSINSGVKEVVEEDNIDLVIMGSHGASGLKELFIGSNAEKVVRTSKVPILIIKSEHIEFNVKDFVFASDFKDDNVETYRKATEMAEVFGAKLHLLLVSLPGKFKTEEEAKLRIEAFIEDYAFKNYTLNIINANTVEKGILKFSRSINADLIGISTHGRQGIAHFLNGSIGEDIANHAKRPVMTFRI